MWRYNSEAPAYYIVKDQCEGGIIVPKQHKIFVGKSGFFYYRISSSYLFTYFVLRNVTYGVYILFEEDLFDMIALFHPKQKYVYISLAHIYFISLLFRKLDEDREKCGKL